MRFHVFPYFHVTCSYGCWMIDRGGDSTSSPALANRPGTWCENDRLANNASRGLSNHQHHCAGLFRSPFGQTAHSSTHLNYHFMHSTTFWGCVPGRGEKTWKVVKSDWSFIRTPSHLTREFLRLWRGQEILLQSLQVWFPALTGFWQLNSFSLGNCLFLLHWGLLHQANFTSSSHHNF